MAYPVTLNGRTYTLADFEGTNYVEGLPDAFEDFVTHAGDIYNSTSTTSNTIGTGSKTFTVEASKPYQEGTPLRIADAAAPSTNFIDAIVTSYSGTTLVVDAVGYQGSGTKTSWKVNIGGAASVQGTLGIASGGTGASTAADARTNLDVYSKSDADSRFLNVSGEASDVTMTGNVTIGDAAGDTLSVPATASFSGGSSFSGGISGDVAFDTDTLFVDSANDRVGINKAAPSVPLHIDIGTENNAIYIESSDQFANIGLVDGSGSGKIIMDGGDLLLTSGGDATTSFTGSAEAMRVDSSQRVLINTNTSRVVGGAAQSVTQIYSTSNGSLLSLFRDQASNNGAAIIRGGKARNGAIVQDNDSIFSLEAVAHDGTDMGSFAGTIAFLVDGTPGANDTPSRIAFYTTADGSASGSERMRITSSGDVGILNTAPSTITSANSRPGLVVGSGSGNNGVTVYSGTGSSSSLFFADGTSGANTYIGMINYNHSEDALAISTTAIEAMRIDSSQRVLIGTDSSVDTAGISARLQMVGTNSSTSSSTFTRFSANNGAPSVRLGKSRSASPSSNAIVQDGDYLGTVNFVADDGTDLYSTAAFISGQVDGTPGSNDMPGRLAFFTTPDGATSSTERMRIEENGRTLIGKTTAGLNNEGFEWNNANYIGSTRSAGITAYFNRKTSDGDIVEFRKDNSTHGRIGVRASDLYIGTGDLGMRFYDAGDAIIPTTTGGSSSDAAKDLGYSSIRWRNLYLSGGAYLGGATGANRLDDYEEGTWTPSFNYGTSITYGTSSGKYTKIGNMVYVEFIVQVNSHDNTDSSDIHLVLPFAPAANDTALITLNEPECSLLKFTTDNTKAGSGGRIVNLNEINFSNRNESYLAYDHCETSGALMGAAYYRTNA